MNDDRQVAKVENQVAKSSWGSIFDTTLERITKALSFIATAIATIGQLLGLGQSWIDWLEQHYKRWLYAKKERDETGIVAQQLNAPENLKNQWKELNVRVEKLDESYIDAETRAINEGRLRTDDIERMKAKAKQEIR
jgi:hypothetical protein